jgi:hypothetical protein
MCVLPNTRCLCFILYTLYLHRFAFSSYSPKLSVASLVILACLYLDDYACHYARMSGNEM